MDNKKVESIVCGFCGKQIPEGRIHFLSNSVIPHFETDASYSTCECQYDRVEVTYKMSAAATAAATAEEDMQ